MKKYIVPDERISHLSPFAKNIFVKWRAYMYENVHFNRPDSEIHAWGHCERVLLYAVTLGAEIFGNNLELLTALAHAAIFHDTRRQNDYLDKGHGARAAVYYNEFCKCHGDINYYEAAGHLMRYHDINDTIGIEAITTDFGENKDDILLSYAIFKDSDALDRFRLGDLGLDPKYLRTPEARNLISFAKNMVHATVPAKRLKSIDKQVKRVFRNKRYGK